MELNTVAIVKAVEEGLIKGIHQMLTANYNNPLTKVVESAMLVGQNGIRELILESIECALQKEDVRRAIKEQCQAALARTLVKRFGGELEKQVNALKSDPATRARITLAIEDICKTKMREP